MELRNDQTDLIFQRRSIRKYQSDEVEDAKIHVILEAAMAAPSAVAKDPWHFIVVKDKNILVNISNGLPNGKMLASAPLGIVVCGDINQAHDHQLSYMIQDCTAAIENILLAVQATGLGACWLGIHPRDDRVMHLKNLFNLPEHIIPISCIAIGYPGEAKEARTRYNDEKVHYDQW